MRNNNKKIMLLIAVTLLISMLYLFVGIDFEIFEYQFSSRLKKVHINYFSRCCHCNFSGDISSDYK